MSDSRAFSLARWRVAYAEAGNWRIALGWFGQYIAVRLWTLVIGCFPIETNLRTARLMGRIWWMLMAKHRARAMDNLRPALGAEYSDDRLRNIARRSFEHFAQVYLVEMALTP